MSNSLYSYKKNYPQELPFSLQLDNGLTITEIRNLPDEQLREYGFTGPHTVPHYDPIEQDLVWVNNTFKVIDLDISQVILNITNNPNIFISFFERFKTSCLFLKVLDTYNNDLSLKIKYTEFLLSEQNLKILNALDEQYKNINMLFSCINFFYNYFNLDEVCKSEIKNLLIETKLDKFGKFFELNETFNSWILQENGTTKLSPIPYPNDGKNYEWNEIEKEWVVEI